MPIKRNAIKCLKCNQVIESEHHHDFKWCECKTCFVDGGKDYIRYGADDPTSIEILTEWEDNEQN